MSDVWLTVIEAAEAAGVQTETIKRHIRAGQLPHRRERLPWNDGFRYLVRELDLLDCLPELRRMAIKHGSRPPRDPLHPDPWPADFRPEPARDGRPTVLRLDAVLNDVDLAHLWELERMKRAMEDAEYAARQRTDHAA